MSVPTLFIGVVSYRGSRFSGSQGHAGLARQLASVIPDVQVHVNVENLLEADSALVTPSGVQAALSAEARLEKDWARFVGRPRDLRWMRFRASRWGLRAWHRLRPPSTEMLRRLLNIELSHLNLMHRGLSSGAPWVLILEDDAFSSKPSDLALGLTALTDADGLAEGVGYANLSESFSAAELGIGHLLQPAQVTWRGSTARSLVTSSRPVTNTVCAILYSSSFLTRLVAVIDELPMEPVVPIDWKLNMALMALYEAGEAPPGTCLLVEPAPITQLSMRPTGILAS